MDWEWLCKFETCNTEEKHPYNVYRWVRLKKTLSIVFLFTGGGEQMIQDAIKSLANKHTLDHNLMQD